MKLLQDMVAHSRRLLGHRWHLPEYRPVELYTTRKKLSFEEDAAGTGAGGGNRPELLGAMTALMLLESWFDAQDALLHEGKTSWGKYLALPRRSTTDKLAAEVFRLLRLLRIAATHAAGQVELRDGLIRAACNFNRCALALHITPAGLALIESFVFCYLDLRQQPYSDAYVEAVLTQYFSDIVAEIRKFADEDRVLFQFRPKLPWFNRHFRLDCDNPRFQDHGEHLHFELGRSYTDPGRNPLDFFLQINDVLYIVPIEALEHDRISKSALPAWQAKIAGKDMPAAFRMRFSRELIDTGLPMT